MVLTVTNSRGTRTDDTYDTNTKVMEAYTTIDVLFDTDTSDNPRYFKPWIGIVNYPVNFVRQNLDSLTHCVTVVTYSKSASDILTKDLADVKLKIPVRVAGLPCTLPLSLFTMGKYVSNRAKRCIRVAEWNGIFENEPEYSVEFVLGNYHPLLDSNLVFFILDPLCYSYPGLSECVDKNLPVVVNKTQYSVEILGEDYPLFYDTDTYGLLPETTTDKISKAYTYIKRLQTLTSKGFEAIKNPAHF